MWGAARDGASAKRYAEAFAAKHPQTGDGAFVLGAYNYYVELAPSFAKVLRFLLFIPAGNRVEGLKQIERAYREGSLFSFPAGMLLLEIYGSFEGRPAEGVQVAERLAAAEVAAFHAQVARAGPGSEFGSPEDVIAQARQNFDQVRALGPDPESAAALNRLAAWTEREFAHRARVFAARRDEGFVRECHGDLHLRNLLLLDGRIVPFDCIEFNAHFRWIDVMSEIAFLVMDLVDHRFAAHAGRFLDAYLEETGDYAGLACLRFYLVYRAMVRAKVACMRAHQLPAGAPERAPAEREFREYLRLAERFVALERRALILTRGLSGSGKTVFSGLLVEEIGAIRVRSDVERKRLHGLAAGAQSGAALGGGIYAQDATRRTYARLAEIARIVLDAGFPAVADATFLRRADRDALRAVARAGGATFAIAACEAPEPVLRERILARARAGGDASEATLDVLAKQIATAEPLAGEELAFAVRVDTTRNLASLRASAAALGARLGVGSWRSDPSQP